MNKQTQFIKVYSILTLKKVELFKRSKTMRLGLFCGFSLIRHAVPGIAKGTIAGAIIGHWTGFLKFSSDA